MPHPRGRTFAHTVAVRKKKPQPDDRPPSQPFPVPPLADPAEAVERIVPRRQLLFEDGDVIIAHAPGGLLPRARLIYQLQIRGKGPMTDRFVSFEHAAAVGDAIASRHRVRLFYVDSDKDQEIPHLLKDYRPPRRNGSR